METMKKQSPEAPLLPAYKARLDAMRENITPRDRIDAAATLGVTYVTVSNYISGRGTSLQTYESLLSFFTNRITSRQKSLGV